MQAKAPSFDDDVLGLRAEVRRLHAESVEAQRALIDARRDADEARREASELREALCARDAFIATAGHELRNAVGGIVVAATNLQFLSGHAGGIPPWVEARLRAIVHQSRGFARRATTLLDVSRLTSGGLRLDLGPASLRDIVETAVLELAPAAERARCDVSLVAVTPVEGTWDRDALEQVAVNLLSNAMKYGAGKPIELEVTSSGSDALLRVRDHGVGIGEEDRARIFGRFERAARRGDAPGFGMGLWIARQLVHAHGGEISVDSEPGRGSLFTVRLPGMNLGHGDELPRIPAKT
jgi:two-component system, OmpR family, sensor kinase